MRQVKWASLAFLLGLIVVLNPGYSPAQFGKRPEGGGGFGKRPEGGEGGGFGKRSEGGGFGKRPEGGGGFGGAPASAPGGFGGAPAPLPPGGGMGGGGFGGGGMGGGGRGMGDPNQMWDWMARGQDSINLNDPQHSRTKERMLQRGEQIPPDGILTRQMFVAAAQQRMAASGAPAPGAPGAPVAMVIGGAPGGPGVPMTVAMGGPMGGGGEDMATRRIKEQDRDGDGKVSFNEADDRLKPNFQKMDRNGDGFLDMEEYRAATGGGGGGRDRDRNGGMGPGGAGDYGFAGGSGDYGRRDDKRVTEEPKPVAMRYGHLPKDMPEWFDKDDGNKDGQVALHEWRRAGKDLSEFYAYDLNADGLVTADEFLRFGVLKTENEKIAAINNPDGVRPSFAGGGRGSGGFALPGSTPPSSDRISATNDKGSDKGKGKGDKGGKDEKAPDGGNGGQNPFRKKN